MYLIDEMLSPLITPFILYFQLRNRSGQVIDFLRNFTIDVSGTCKRVCACAAERDVLKCVCVCVCATFVSLGVGDVCSFAEMDVRKHGHPDVSATGGFSFLSSQSTSVSFFSSSPASGKCRQ